MMLTGPWRVRGLDRAKLGLLSRLSLGVSTPRCVLDPDCSKNFKVLKKGTLLIQEIYIWKVCTENLVWYVPVSIGTVKNRGKIYTLLRYESMKTCHSTRFKHQWTELFLKKLETEDFTWLSQTVLLTFDFLEVQIRSLEILYHCGIYNVFPHMTMSQQYNYYSQKCRLRKSVQLKAETVITRDEKIIKFHVFFSH